MPPPAAQAWPCPGCGNFYRIAPGRRAPALCPTCRAERDEAAPAPPEPSAFDQLVAVVEEAERDEPPTSDDAIPSAESAVDDAEAIPIARRPRLSSRWRVVAVMGGAIVVLASWGLYGVWKQFERSTPGDAAVWAQAKLEVADHLRAPKTAEFPKPGEIKRIRDSALPRWSGKSVVDAKNEYGVPLRHRWFMEMSFDKRSRKWEAEYIEIDDQRVYASQATTREDREYAEKREARDKAANQGRDKSKPRKRIAPAREDAVAERHGEDPGPAVGTRAAPEESVEARRETGKWNEVVQFEGQASHDTARFKVKLPGWRFRWICDGEATIRLFDAAHKPVEDEIDIGGGEKGTRYVSKGTGEFSLGITTKSHWTLVVEE